MSDDPKMAKRAQKLKQVQEWFAPAFDPGEVLRGALAVSPFRVYSLQALLSFVTLRWNQVRVLLVTDQAVHVVRRTGFRMRFRNALASYPRGSVPIGLEGGSPLRDLGLTTGTLVVGDQRFYINGPGYQVTAGTVGTNEDIHLLLEAGAPGAQAAPH
jgi:hypothetical protein